jgi:NAD(P)-dependent dehydrogenase (short-subunit alcohol dehydrogenase family)
MRLEGEIALVTGAAQGIGRATAEALARDGARVAVTDINYEGARAAAAAIGERARGFMMNTADINSIAECAKAVTATMGDVSILVNSAGIQRVGPSESLPRDLWNQSIAVNLTGVFDCIQAFVPGMLSRSKGAIVNLGSVNSEVGMPGRAPYCATKTAILGLTRALATEWASRGVRVNAVEPGYVATPLTMAAIDNGLLDQAQLIDRIPMRRLATADDIARIIVFLCTAEASYVTGVAVAVDGGYLAYGAPRSTSTLPERSFFS